MKTKLFLLALVAFVMHFSALSQVKIGDNPTVINSASLLELETTNKGLVLPRVSLTNVTSVSPLTIGALTGSVVYNTNSSVTGGSGTGIYYWDGSKWNFLNNTSTASYWSLLGNSGTNYATNFLGTTDNVSMRFRTNNIQRMIVDSIGRVGIGLNNPAYALSVLSASDPLYLSGVQATSTFTTDSVLTINAGVVKKAPYSSINGSYWGLTGNSGTSTATNFIGTTDNQSLVFKTNNQLSGKIDLSLNSLSFGYQSANSITTGTNNVFLGYQSGFSTTTGSNNTGVGAQVLKSNTGINNTGVGSSSLRLNTIGGNNTSTGSFSLQVNTTGSNNTATGYSALGSNLQGIGNTANGSAALQGNIQGSNNTAIGNGSMQLNDQGSANTAVGAFALQNSNLGASNTAMGYAALGGNTTGINNTGTGNLAGNTNTTGAANTFIGSQADATLANLSNATAIGANAKVSASNSLVLGGAGVNVGIGTTSPSYKFQVLASSDPLYLGGVQATAAFTTDSLLTIYNGVVKKAPYSSLNTSWSLTGNSATNSSINFLGTTDNHPLKFKVNNILSGFIDSIGGNENTFFGRAAGFKNTSGSTNTLIGIEADSLNITGTGITAVGYQAGVSNTATGLVALGYQAGYGNTSGGFNMFLGTSAGFTNSTGFNNSFMGYGSGFANTTGNNNAFGGYTAGLNNSVGFNNTFIGSNAGSSNTTGSYNTAVGFLAGYRNSTGSRNLFLGDSSAPYNSTALNNASAIGFRATVGQNNSMVLGDTTNSGTVANSYPVNVGIGVRFPQKRLHIDAATIGFPGQSDSLKIDNLAASTSDYNKSILVIDSATGFVSRQNLTAFANNDYWSLTGNSGTGYATNFLGTTDNTSLRFRTNNTERMFIDSLGSVGIGSANFDPYLKEKFLVDYGTTTSNNIATFKGSINDYMQISVQNTNLGNNSSSDFVATASDGTDSTYFIDMGINGGNYVSTEDNWGGPHDGYMYTYGRNLVIGAQSKNSDILFLLGGGRSKFNSVMRMDGTTGNIIIGTGNNQTNATGNIIRGPNGGSGTNIPGGILTLQGGSGNGTATGGALTIAGGAATASGLGGNVNINGGASTSGTGGDIVFNTASTERMRINAAGNVGIGINSPSYKLQVLAASNPLYLAGVQATLTFTSDSILTINAGIVKKAPYSSLPSGSSGSGWLLTGNTGTTSSNFLGTTDAQPLIIKSLNRQLGYFDGNLYNIALGFGASNNISDHNIAIGYNATTNNQYTLALGYSATASGVRSVAIGNGGSATVASGAEAVAIGFNATGSGNQSTALGYQAAASGAYALAMGYTAVANKDQTTAIGYNAQATGQYGTAIGFQAIASGVQSNAIGYGAQATQQYSSAFGYNAQATGTQSTAIGYQAQTSQSNTILLGNASTPNLYVGIGTATPTAKLHIVGGTTTNYPLQLVGLPTGVAGTDNIMTVNSVGVVGYVTSSTFNNSYWNLSGNAATSGNFLGTTNSTPLQFKFNNTAAGYLDANNTSFGTSAVSTSGLNNTAIGFSATAANSATAIGANAVASQASNTAIGNSASANTSSQATAIGASSQALFQYNTAIGYNAQATISSQETVVGASAQAQGQNNISIGYSAKANGSDKMTVVGSNAQGSFQNNTVIGSGALATVNNQATAVGATAQAQAQNATALGYAASASGINATALGDNTIASAQNATALGNNASATGQNSTALGNNATASQANAFVLGNSNVNVGIGTSTPNTSVKLDVDGAFKLGDVGTVTKNIVNFSSSVNTNLAAGTGGAIVFAGNVTFAASSTDVTVTIPAAANFLSSTQAVVSVSPAFDLPASISIASARMISTSQVRIRFVNASTNAQTVLGNFYISIHEF